MAKTYRHLFFDLDHTLWDFERNSGETLGELFAEYSLAGLGLALGPFATEFAAINRELWRLYDQHQVDKATLRQVRFQRVLARFGVVDDALAHQLTEAYFARCPAKPHLMPHSAELLAYLAPRYQLHIITNGFDDIQATKLHSAGIAHYFGQVLTSENSGHRKPSPEIFALALARTGAAVGESLMIGDNLDTDMAGGRAAGLDTLYYNPDRLAHQAQVTFEVHCHSEVAGRLL
jgi:putative hydrolase of the HAD superfamily